MLARETAPLVKHTGGRGSGNNRKAPGITPTPKANKRQKRGDSAGAGPVQHRMPTLDECIDGASPVQGRSVMQLMYNAKQRLDSKFQQREITQMEHIEQSLQHKIRMNLIALSAGNCERLGLEALEKCIVSVWDSAEPLPTRAFQNYFARKAQIMLAQPVLRLDALFDLADPTLAAVSQKPPPGVAYVPEKLLDADKRWSVAQALWLQVLLPRMLSTVQPGDPTFQSRGGGIAEMEAGVSAAGPLQ